MRKLVIVFFLCSLIVLCVFEAFFLSQKYMLLYEYTLLVEDSHFRIYRELVFHGSLGCIALVCCIFVCFFQLWTVLRHPARQTYEEYKLLQEKLKEQKKHRQTIKKAKQIEKLQKKLAEMEKAE